MKNLGLRHLFLLLLMVLSAQMGWSQGTTTAAMNGIITDKAGAGLPGATVIAVHTPTNTQYVAPTNAEGRFNIQNMRVGGPYTVRVTFIGYKEAVREGLSLALGQNQRLDINLSEETTQLSGVTITGQQDLVINSGRTGASTSVQREQIQRLPTLNRSLQDFTRLTPQASGNSIGGSNNRFNNITIDGAVNNDVFGLAGSGTPGGQAGTQPISLDAIDQIQVNVAPYDVKLGNFTGGGINAVTRSGTNDLSASIYGFYRDENTTGKSISEPRTKAADFSNYQTGVRIGGPIIKDKLFFFANGEISRRREPLLFLPGTSESRFRMGELDTLALRTREKYGYDIGNYGAYTRRTDSDKIFARLDWNINSNNQLTLRHNFVQAFDDNLSRSSNSIRLGNNAYVFNNVTNSTVLELNSKFGEIGNNLILSYGRIRDNRDVAGSIFPQAQISDKGRTLFVGSERSSVANELDQDIIELTDNVTKTFGKHNFTLGTHNEIFKFRNLFINNLNGRYDFSSINNFVNGAPSRVRATYSLDPNNPLPDAGFTAAQLGFYVQDEYNVLDNLRLTAGVRLDVPVFADQPANNPLVEKTFGSDISTSNTPNGELLWAPRLGFNWDVNNDSKVQVRGGTGVFTGRVPYVWISNGFTNNGLTLGTIDLRSTTAAPLAFEPDYTKLSSTYASGAVKTTEINVIGKDFKIPQVWRSNLAADFKLPGDVTFTLEGIYSKTLNDIYYKDINLKAPVGRLAGADNRPVYAASTNDRRVNQAFTNVLLLDNTSKGYRYNLTAQAQKAFAGGLNTSLAYTYGESKDINSGTSSTALSNWEFNQINDDPNNPALSYSTFDLRHRILGTGGYTFSYAGDKMSTTLSVVYEGQSGRPFTYLYGQLGRDLNNDGAFSNDLFYIPRNESEISLVAPTGDNRTPSQIWADLDYFISQDDYLSKHRGEYAERNAARTPWTHQFDFRIAQNFNFLAGGKKNSLELSLDIINAGNLLNKDWGRQYFVTNNAYELLKVESVDASGRPSFSFPNAFSPTTGKAYDVSSFTSRWQGQFGVRYSFN
ncbi:carboxypeptidase regulatory-like domain-containing protein [Hymenobacter sp. BT730]|uniref:TonB-dependent receptor n=1 Tax=Hymenobacter sp. BT730 TaxID=3063332 RepID=UPI0026DF5566|nr:carboxypeptidase regulatory-like domain-containing protein [Hymenobacter sp. BT730]